VRRGRQLAPVGLASIKGDWLGDELEGAEFAGAVIQAIGGMIGLPGHCHIRRQPARQRSGPFMSFGSHRPPPAQDRTDHQRHASAVGKPDNLRPALRDNK